MRHVRDVHQQVICPVFHIKGNRIVQVTRVDKKLSYARLYSGEIDDDAIENGVVLRPHRTTPEEAAAAAKAAEEARAKASQGVRLPFD